MAKLPWTPWHQVVQLRDDLKTGDLALHQFAADLYEVTMQSGKRPVYEEPEHFFALTFPTHNLRNLVRDVCLRVAGKSDKAVRQLELTYGGGKTHTLITLFHLVNDPANLPDLPAVKEFEQAIGETPTAARVAALCFDKLDVEKGMSVKGPDGKSRTLKQPWSVMAYQLAGDEGLKLLHAEGKAEERQSAPAENLLTELLEMPGKDGLSTLTCSTICLVFSGSSDLASTCAAASSRPSFFGLSSAAFTFVFAGLGASDPDLLPASARRRCAVLMRMVLPVLTLVPSQPPLSCSRVIFTGTRLLATFTRYVPPILTSVFFITVLL